jgi:hypothetical protein
MKHKPVQWGWPPKDIRATWHPVRSIGDFYSDLNDWEKGTAKDLAKRACRMPRQDIISAVAHLKKRAEANAVLKAVEESNGAH